MVQPVAEPQHGDDFVDIRLIRPAAVEMKGEQDILIGGQLRQQVIKLKDKAYPTAPEDGALIVV